MGNAAFDDADKGPELARILTAIADELSESQSLDFGYRARLFDINGNSCGFAELTTTPEELGPMSQQVNVFVKLTYDANARLDAEQLRKAILADIEHLRTPTGHSPVELMTYEIKHLAEEAEIYGNEGVATAEHKTQTYTAFRSAQDSFDYYVRTGHGDPVSLAMAAQDAEREFIKAHSFAV
jgi:hypothetical protein